ncbi:peptidylprolyl isomerase [Brevibacillus composti]|uniref:Peptidylprolyl isomerase n=2 Tax=Brevibacillus composti TaxID=2796470 RepID=A0A7T5EN87_9BACL|nr:peptidylprolyl isomerase [Brevibacillus composti]QUO42736.1 peptidylprolyl isomerase [Brevibacillus composti]
MAKERLQAYYQAELAVLSGQEYRIGTRTLRRADLSEIRKAISELERQVQQLENQAAGNRSARARRIVIRDL